MSALPEAWRRLRALLRRGEIENRLDDEMRFHLEQQIEKNVRSGMSPDEATARLRDDVGLSREAALAEIRRQCAMPTYAASYAAGRREILNLRDAARQAEGERFSLLAFHDRLLAYGRLPLALARWGMGFA